MPKRIRKVWMPDFYSLFCTRAERAISSENYPLTLAKLRYTTRDLIFIQFSQNPLSDPAWQRDISFTVIKDRDNP